MREVAEIRQAVIRARNRLRAATRKDIYTKENIQCEHIDHKQVAEKQQAASRACVDAQEELNTSMNEGEMCAEVVPVMQTMSSRWKRWQLNSLRSQACSTRGTGGVCHKIQFKQVDHEHTRGTATSSSRCIEGGGKDATGVQ